MVHQIAANAQAWQNYRSLYGSISLFIALLIVNRSLLIKL